MKILKNQTSPNDIINKITEYKTYLLSICNTTSSEYSAYFTSGEIESNNILLTCAVNAYSKLKKIKPHIIISATEHNSILTHAYSLRDSGLIEMDLVYPNSYGCILSESIPSLIKPNTCLAIITYINQEMGSVNNIEKIGSILHTKKIPIHSNCSDMFGIHKLDLKKNMIDSVAISFDKIGGPVDVGVLIINNSFFTGYALWEHSTTLENKRKYNIPSIASAIEATKNSKPDRIVKNEMIAKFRNEIITELGKNSQSLTFANFMKSDEPPLHELETSNRKFIILGPPIDNTAYYTPGILSFMIINKYITDEEKRR